LPKRIDGVDEIELLVIDDGSTDRTAEVAREHGVGHVVRFSSNRGLAAAFRVGLETAVGLGADIIVNTDADNQYCGAHVERLVRPIIDGQADIVIGDRGVWSHREFGPVKKSLQAFGSWIISRLSRLSIPDATSGFRAYSRDAALGLHVLSDYTYTQETIIQAGLSNLTVMSVPIDVNAKTRPSRLFRTTLSYVTRSAGTILRIFTFYRPMRAFFILATIPFLLGLALGTRFLYFFFFTGERTGHIQSLILCATLLNLSFVMYSVGIAADLIGLNRRLIEDVLSRIRKLERSSTDKPE